MDHFGIVFGLLWDNFLHMRVTLVRLGSTLGYFGTLLGAFWGRFGVVLWSLWGHLGVTLCALGSLWVHFDHMNVTFESRGSGFKKTFISPLILMILCNCRINFGTTLALQLRLQLNLHVQLHLHLH